MKNKIELSDKITHKIKGIKKSVRLRKEKEESRMNLIAIRDELNRKVGLINNDINTLDAELIAESSNGLDSLKSEIIDEVMKLIEE